jgi:hypothetical protein
MNRNGSGKLTMEFSVSRLLENLGSLDGNAQWPTIPIGRADWERTMARIQGARITSFSTREVRQDTVTTIVIEYDNPQALLAIVEPGNRKSSIVLENQQGRFDYIISDGFSEYLNFSEYDETILELARTMFADYNFSINFSAHGNSTLTITDGTGKEVKTPAAARVVPSGRRVSMSIGMMDLIDIQDGLGISLRW